MFLDGGLSWSRKPNATACQKHRDEVSDSHSNKLEPIMFASSIPHPHGPSNQRTALFGLVPSMTEPRLFFQTTPETASLNKLYRVRRPYNRISKIKLYRPCRLHDSQPRKNCHPTRTRNDGKSNCVPHLLDSARREPKDASWLRTISVPMARACRQLSSMQIITLAVSSDKDRDAMLVAGRCPRSPQANPAVAIAHQHQPLTSHVRRVAYSPAGPLLCPQSAQEPWHLPPHSPGNATDRYLSRELHAPASPWCRGPYMA
jgi:hypothetical protein